MNPEWIVLDIDGVLISVENSYDLAVKKTVEKLWTKLGNSGSLSLETIRDFRKKGQFGDDYSVTEGLTLAGLNEDLKNFVEEFPRGEEMEWIINRTGKRIGKENVKPIFDRLYLGKEDSPSEDGLWRQEKPVVDTSLLDKIEEQFKLGYITGRSRQELKLASRVLNHELSVAVTREDFLKPDPRALTHMVGESSGIYSGDTHNDRLLVENYNEETEGNFEFVMIDHDNPTNQVLRDLLDKS
ncbi:MAG: hydrolase [Candidatus Bipolaricaulota bacterium]|nr:hydrolase [Candidatus Bipolaricaulota bacterium]MBS3791397.1 hydrolase [Candidatus Bipolaricaulota bacterium]